MKRFNNINFGKSEKRPSTMKLFSFLTNNSMRFILFVLFLFTVDFAFAQIGMRNFTGNLGGSSGGSGGGAGVPIDGGLLAGSAGYAYKKLRKTSTKNS